MREFFDLLRVWCDGMISRQITEIKEKGIYGGLMCPACSRVHGRCYGAVHPFLYVAEKTGDKKYVSAAERLIEWSGHMQYPDGSFVNDTTSEWKGISVFSSISLSKALYRYGGLLSPAIRESLEKKACACLEYIYKDFDAFSGNINYLIGAAYALELGGKYQNNKAYRNKAKEYARLMLEHLTQNNLIYGEGGATWNQCSPKGCYPVDIGYNVEESINLMALYALSANDQVMLKRTVEIAKAHADFILPDGGWDNSLGTRMDKWTYWGSRTSDGCQPAYTILSKYDKSLGPIAYNNYQYLKSCTYDGLLFGGRDLYIHGEPPCIHHTFTHAEGLAIALEWMDKNGEIEDTSYNPVCFQRYYEELDTYLYASKSWRATITGYDIVEKPNCHPTGGALSLLYHQGAGPVLVSSMTVYSRFEDVNTQRHMDGLDTPLTLRLQMVEDGVIYSNILDKKAVIKQIGDNEFVVTGNITNHYGNSPKSGTISFTARYTFEEDTVAISYTHTSRSSIDIYIPIVSSAHERVDGLSIEKGNYTLELSADNTVTIEKKGRIFNHVPGFEAVPYIINNAKPETNIRIKLTKRV